ncbi:MAG TPA: AMP-binding protein [Ktedonobacteraceae bacterium]|nr:AMP-binding protein [Ktedonobacteraceae bacterium]
MYSLQRSLEQWAAIDPQKICVIEAETEKSITYIHFLSSVYAIRELIGDSPRCIALALPGGITSAVVWISALTGGHTLIPLSPDAANLEKARMAREYHPDIFIVEQEQDAQGFACASAIVITRQQCETLIEQDAQEFHESMPARAGQVCLHTSGSTGKAKGVMLQEQQIAWTAHHVSASHHLSARDTGLTVLPFFHVNAPVVSLCATVMSGSTVVIARRFSRRNFWAYMERFHVTWASIVPAILALLLDTEKPAFLPGDIRFIRTASAPLPASHLRAFEEKFGLPVVETYGLSEAASQVAANPVPPGIHKAASVGLPVGVSMRICHPLTGQTADEQAWTDVEPGATGEICIRGPNVIQAYVGDVDQKSFQHGWFRTGDLGYQDHEGYVFITGRLREVINRGGENIAPREIEEVLLDHPLVHEAAVVARPHAIYGEVVVAYIVTRRKTHASIQQQLHQYAAQHLSPVKVPVDFIIVDTLPRTSSGKIARQVLREREVRNG